MREIKFRAWLSGTHENLTFRNSGMDYKVRLSSKGNWLDVESDWDIKGEYPTIPIMQYTGLKDKNGKEIYEGDIVKVSSSAIFGGSYIKEIAYVEQSARFHAIGTLCDNLAEFMCDTSGVNKSEVIGNIYENPEILK